jgi:hypothetical protein
MAAFMNLSLRSRGKDLCAEQPELVLSKPAGQNAGLVMLTTDVWIDTLANLLGHEIIEVGQASCLVLAHNQYLTVRSAPVSMVPCTRCSIAAACGRYVMLHLQTLRMLTLCTQAAQVLGYKDLIKAQREVSDADMQAQLDYVTQQLESDVRGRLIYSLLCRLNPIIVTIDASEREGYESDDGEQLDEGADHAQVTESDPLQLDLEQVGSLELW